ncbi:hypothetical protein [Paenibacillus sp. KN14-4R]|uniref:hypothetical protein n=1 Tax=Paenibacillus sp. KN14-4R TaxID=3445773 RepID=UPI003F9FF4F6
MTKWQGIKFLTKREFTNSKSMYVGAIVFIGIAFVVIVSMMMVTSERGVKGLDSGAVYFPINMITIFYLAMTGFGIKSSYMKNYWKTDTFTKEVSWLKLMPISSKQIVISKFIKFTILIVALDTILFCLLYTVKLNGVLDFYGVTGLEFIQMALVIIGYSMLTGSLYMWMEMSLSGKWYFILNLIILIIGTILLIVFGLKISVWEFIADQVKTYSWIAPGVMILLGIVAMIGAGKIIESTMNRRDLYI